MSGRDGDFIKRIRSMLKTFKKQVFSNIRIPFIRGISVSVKIRSGCNVSIASNPAFPDRQVCIKLIPGQYSCNCIQGVSMQLAPINYIFNTDDKYKLIEAIDPRWQGALPYTFLVEPNDKIVYAKEGIIDPPALKKPIVDKPYIGRHY